MRFRVLACDYDGTIASHGVAAPDTIAALEAVVASGRKLMIVTGRIVSELVEIFPPLEMVDVVVAENGALLYWPTTKRVRPLCDPIPRRLVEELRHRGVAPLSAGLGLCSTVDAHERIVEETLADLELNHEILRNKHSLMVLPRNVDKASGFRVALAEVNQEARAAVAVGDAENDLAFLALAGCGVAVANAVGVLKDRADIVTDAPNGAGVAAIARGLIRDDLKGALSSRW